MKKMDQKSYNRNLDDSKSMIIYQSTNDTDITGKPSTKFSYTDANE